MTTTTDPVRAFTDALPAHLKPQLAVTQAATAAIHAAVRDQGWTPDGLAREASRDLGGVVNAGALMMHRLRHAAGNPPPTGRRVKRPDWCGTCDPDTRHAKDDNGYPSAERCQTCHPLSRKTSA